MEKVEYFKVAVFSIIFKNSYKYKYNCIQYKNEKYLILYDKTNSNMNNNKKILLFV